VLGGSHPQS